MVWQWTAISQPDCLGFLLAAAAMLLAPIRGQNHPKQDELRQATTGLAVIAAENAGVALPDGFLAWFTQNRLNDPAYVIPALTAHLEALIGDRWIFDRTPLLAQAKSAAAS